MKRKTKHPLMLWHAGMGQYVWWPHGRRRLYGHTVSACNMSTAIRADYGQDAPLFIHRVDAKTEELIKDMGPLLPANIKAAGC